MTCYSQSFIIFSKSLMEKQGDDIRRWAADPNPVIAREFKSVIEAAEAVKLEK